MNAHGITRVGPAKVGGRHLSDAANEPPFSPSNQARPGAPLKGITMSVFLHTFLDAERLKDCAANEAAMGITPALDEASLARVDSAMLADKQADGYEQRRLARGLELERQRAGVML